MESRYYIYDEELEKLVLGTILSKRTALDEVRDIIMEDCFFIDLHRQIFNAIIEVDKRGDEPDSITVLAEIKKVNDKVTPVDILQISNNQTFTIVQHARRLKDLSIRRNFYRIGQFLLSNATNELTDIEDVVADATKKINNLLASDDASIATFGDALQEIYDNININLSEQGLTGYPTGFSRLDEHGGGLHGGDLIIVAAESSMGKTAFSVSLCANACRSGAKVAFYSLEMEKKKLAARILAQESGVSSSRMLYNKLTDEELYRVDKAIGRVSEMKFFFDDRSTVGFDNILSSIRSMKNKYDIDGVVVDYLQILTVNSKKTSNNEDALAEMARRLKNIAKELDIWIVTVSQLNRDRDNVVPTMARLRGSGQIAEAADIVMLIYRPEYYNKNLKYPEPFENASTQGTAMIDVVKGRNIGVCRFLVGFNAPLTHFYDMDDIPPVEEIYEDKPF